VTAPRTILYTGKGGVGKTSVAAATARRCAAAGLRTVVLSTDPAHSLSDSLETPLGAEPTPVGESLWGQEVQAQREMEANWGAVQEWLRRLLADRGVMEIAAEELTVPPGMDELFSLLQIKRHHTSGHYDVIVVDCAPTGETLRLLSFPDIARWWLEKVFPWERRVVAAARPIARTLLDVPLPGEDVFSDVQRLVRNLIAMNEILRDRQRASIRLVMNPDRMVIREAQRTFTYLNLYGYLTDAVIVNRVFPADVAGGYFGPWRERQREQLGAVAEGFGPVPILSARYFDSEVLGAEMLDRLAAELFEDRPPHEVLYSELAHELGTEDGRTILRLRIPFSDKDDIRVRKVGAELIVGVGREKRTIILPSALSERRPAGASFEGGTLKVSFDDGRSPRREPGRGSGVRGREPERQPEPLSHPSPRERQAQRA
jgi:arsenite-transporting ATPase